MTGPQQSLLAHACFQSPKALHVRGDSLQVARNLERAGLVTLRIGGSGVPFKGHWWYEIVPTDKGWAEFV